MCRNGKIDSEELGGSHDRGSDLGGDRIQDPPSRIGAERRVAHLTSKLSLATHTAGAAKTTDIHTCINIQYGGAAREA